MHRGIVFAIASAALVTLAVSQPVSAQTRYDFKMANGFIANGKTLPAGNYTLAVDPAADLVTLSPMDAKGGSVLMMIETRTAANKPLAAPEVIFDKLNGQLYLSELLVPGEDGYVLYVTKAKHTHESLRGTSSKK